MSTKRFAVAAVTFTIAAALILPATALAQRGGGGGGRGVGRAVPPPGRAVGAPPPVHGGGVRGPVYAGQRAYGGPRVAVGVRWGWGYGYGPWGPYGAWGYGWGPWGPYGPWGGWGYSDYLYASARIQVVPKQAEVFVDGYRAGTVDDFDGIFQRLNVWPGEHQVTLFLEGYATENHLLYMAQGTTANLKGTLEKLPDGVKSEPPPQPAPRPQQQQQPQQSTQGGGGYRQPANPPPTEPATIEVQQQAVRFGAVSIKVQPADAVIVIDDQIWTGPAGDQRLNVQLATGRHHVEVRKEGFVTYAEDVLIRVGATLTLNVSLSRK